MLAYIPYMDPMGYDVMTLWIRWQHYCDTLSVRLVVFRHPSEKYDLVIWMDGNSQYVEKSSKPCSIIDYYIPLYPMKKTPTKIPLKAMFQSPPTRSPSYSHCCWFIAY